MRRRRPRPPAILGLAAIIFCLIPSSIAGGAQPITQADVSSTNEAGFSRDGKQTAAACTTCGATTAPVDESDATMPTMDTPPTGTLRDGTRKRPGRNGVAVMSSTPIGIFFDKILQRSTGKDDALCRSPPTSGTDDSEYDVFTAEDGIVDSDSSRSGSSDALPGLSSTSDSEAVGDHAACPSCSVSSGMEKSAGFEDSTDSEEVQSFRHGKYENRLDGEHAQLVVEDDGVNQKDAMHRQARRRGAAPAAETGSTAVETGVTTPTSEKKDNVNSLAQKRRNGWQGQSATLLGFGQRCAASIARFTARPNRGDVDGVCNWDAGGIGSHGQSYTTGSFDDDPATAPHVTSAVPDPPTARADSSETPETLPRVADVLEGDAAADDSAAPSKVYTRAEAPQAADTGRKDSEGVHGNLPLMEKVGAASHKTVGDSSAILTGRVERDLSGEYVSTGGDLASGTEFVEIAGLPGRVDRVLFRGEETVAGDGGDGGMSALHIGKPGEGPGEAGRCSDELRKPSFLSSSLESEDGSSCSMTDSSVEAETDVETDLFLTAATTAADGDNIRGPMVKAVGVNGDKTCTAGDDAPAEDDSLHRYQAEKSGLVGTAAGTDGGDAAKPLRRSVLTKQAEDDVLAAQIALGVRVPSAGQQEDNEQGGNIEAESTASLPERTNSLESDGTESADAGETAKQNPAASGTKKVQVPSRQRDKRRGKTEEMRKEVPTVELRTEVTERGKCQLKSWWKILGSWALFACTVFGVGLLFTGGDVPEWIPFTSGSRHKRWGLDLDAAIASARTRGASFLEGSSGYPPHSTDDFSDLPDLVSDEREFTEAATVDDARQAQSTGRNSNGDDNVIWDTRPKKSPDCLVFDPVLGVVPYGVLRTWQSARPEDSRTRTRPPWPGSAKKTESCCDRQEGRFKVQLQRPSLSESRDTDSVASVSGFNGENLLSSCECDGCIRKRIIGATGEVSEAEVSSANGNPNFQAVKKHKKRPLPPVRYTAEWHAWLATKTRDELTSHSFADRDKQASTGVAKGGRGSNGNGEGLHGALEVGCDSVGADVTRCAAVRGASVEGNGTSSHHGKVSMRGGDCAGISDVATKEANSDFDQGDGEMANRSGLDLINEVEQSRLEIPRASPERVA